MTSPSDTHPIARTITARVHDNAIARVPKLFADSLAAIFTELLQNARRAEATRLYINTGTTPRITPPPIASPLPTTAQASPTPRFCSPSAKPAGTTPPPPGKTRPEWGSPPSHGAAAPFTPRAAPRPRGA